MIYEDIILQQDSLIPSEEDLMTDNQKIVVTKDISLISGDILGQAEVCQNILNLGAASSKRIETMNGIEPIAKGFIPIESSTQKKITITRHHILKPSDIENILENTSSDEEKESKMCYHCTKNIKMFEKDSFIKCVTCIKYFHIKCIDNSKLMLIPLFKCLTCLKV